ncbi:hypothetical protein WA158_000302 [Blastocystis sp. Blastoise]
MTFRTHQRHVKIIKMAKGYRGRAKNCYTIAVRQVHRSWQKMYVGRKLKQRDMRSLWIQRINAASRIFGTSYNKLISQEKKAGILLNRKVLADMAVTEPCSFKAIVDAVTYSIKYPTVPIPRYRTSENTKHDPDYEVLSRVEKQLGEMKLE